MEFALAPDRAPWLTLALAACLLAAPPAARAQEYCVACTEPAAVYRCSVETSTPQPLPSKLLCISTMAREGGHATCAVKGGTVFDCNGPIRRIGAVNPSLGPGNAAGQASPPTQTTPPDQRGQAAGQGPAPAATPAGANGPGPAVAPPVQPASAPQAEANSDQKAPPQTVEQLAKQVGKSSGDGLKSVGDAIVGGSKKAWGCIASLFTSC